MAPCDELCLRILKPSDSKKKILKDPACVYGWSLMSQETVAMKLSPEKEVCLVIQQDGSHEHQSDQGDSLCWPCVRLQSAG